MKSLRRSLVNRDQQPSAPQRISTPLTLPAVSKPPSSVLPPTKVIKAIQSYKSQAPQELSFSKGDFFHVIREVDRGIQWYEAHNPMTGARGLVPRALFEEFGKANAQLRASTVPAGPRNALSTAQRPNGVEPKQSKAPAFFAIVMHDFAAERPDELDARAGDAISVVAQSNREWFVAKPIGKLGRPGLIPISFVEMRDPATGQPILDIESLLDRGDIPLVEEWKRAMNQYKAASIPLGVIDDPAYGPVPNSPYSNRPDPYPSPPSSIVTHEPPTAEPPGRQSPPQPEQSNPILPPGLLVSAEVVSFHYENDEYWFRINALFQPEDPTSSSYEPLPAKQLVLFRVYEDFYDFQIVLLDTFPAEAGRTSSGNGDTPSTSRILPYMPGPVPSVDAMVTAVRREELDEYVRNLCVLREIGAEHILRHDLIRSFFAPRAGDVEAEVEPVLLHAEAPPEEEQYVSDMQDLDIRDGQGREYDYETSDRQVYSRPSQSSPIPPERAPSRATTDGRSRSRQDSHARAPSPSRAAASSSRHPQSSGSSQWRTDDSYSPYSDSNSYGGRPPSSTTTSSTTQQATPSAPVSSGNAQSSFIKIKIFDRQTDDLIAIRVPPKVTHRQLMDKVRERLGNDVSALKFRNSMTGQFTELEEETLHNWLETADKLVLYAD